MSETGELSYKTVDATCTALARRNYNMRDDSYQGMRNIMLRQAIREILLTENYNVSIVGTPVKMSREEESATGTNKKPTKKKRGEEASAEVLSNFILTADDLKDLIAVAQDRDVLKSYDESDAEIKRRLALIGSKVSPAAAKLAALTVNQMTESEKEQHLYNMPGPDQVVTDLHPEVIRGSFREYEIPSFFNDLAMIKKPGGHGESIGRAEALAILMFGRDDEADKEPDLIVGGKGFSVKYFSGNSKTVNPGADLSATPNYSKIVEVTMQLKKLAAMKGIDVGSSDRYISRGQVRKMLLQLDEMIKANRKSNIFVSSGAQRADLDPSGIGDEDLNLALTTGEVDTMVKECGELWDSKLILSGHDVLALVGTSNLKMYVMPKDMVVAGEIIMSGAVPKVAIASPFAGQLKVSPGSGSSESELAED